MGRQVAIREAAEDVRDLDHGRCPASEAVNGPRNLPSLGRAKFPTLAGAVISRWFDRCLHCWAAGRGAWVALGRAAAG